MKIKFKKLHDNAVLPSYAKDGDAAMDLTAVSVATDNESCIVYRTGLAIEIPRNHVGLIFPRSSIYKTDLYLSNHVAVIDSGYRGEISLRYKLDDQFWEFCSDLGGFEENLNAGNCYVYITAEDEHHRLATGDDIYAVGDRIAQLLILPYPTIEPEWSDKLSETDRGTGGFGSSGR